MVHCVHCRLRVLQSFCFRRDTRADRPAAMAEEFKLLNSLLSENSALRRQVSEMEDFLKDHGLVWVGTGAFAVSLF